MAQVSIAVAFELPIADQMPFGPFGRSRDVLCRLQIFLLQCPYSYLMFVSNQISISYFDSLVVTMLLLPNGLKQKVKGTLARKIFLYLYKH